MSNVKIRTRGTSSKKYPQKFVVVGKVTDASIKNITAVLTDSVTPTTKYSPIFSVKRTKKNGNKFRWTLIFEVKATSANHKFDLTVSGKDKAGAVIAGETDSQSFIVDNTIKVGSTPAPQVPVAARGVAATATATSSIDFFHPESDPQDISDEIDYFTPWGTSNLEIASATITDSTGAMVFNADVYNFFGFWVAQFPALPKTTGGNANFTLTIEDVSGFSVSRTVQF